jgi:hypothetical protein
LVDTLSMTSLSDALGIPDDDDHVCDFGEGADVHHLDYFRQAKALGFLRRKLLDG